MIQNAQCSKSFTRWKSRYQGTNFCQAFLGNVSRSWQKFAPWHLIFHHVSWNSLYRCLVDHFGSFNMDWHFQIRVRYPLWTLPFHLVIWLVPAVAMSEGFVLPLIPRTPSFTHSNADTHSVATNRSSTSESMLQICIPMRSTGQSTSIHHILLPGIDPNVCEWAMSSTKRRRRLFTSTTQQGNAYCIHQFQGDSYRMDKDHIISSTVRILVLPPITESRKCRIVQCLWSQSVALNLEWISIWSHWTLCREF